MENIGIILSQNVFIVDDFNLHVDDGNDSYANKFLDLLKDCDFKQHVESGKHKKAHTLDLVITHENSSPLIKKYVSSRELTDPSGKSSGDHYTVVVQTSFAKPKIKPKLTKRRSSISK